MLVQIALSTLSLLIKREKKLIQFQSNKLRKDNAKLIEKALSYKMRRETKNYRTIMIIF